MPIGNRGCLCSATNTPRPPLCRAFRAAPLICSAPFAIWRVRRLLALVGILASDMYRLGHYEFIPLRPGISIGHCQAKLINWKPAEAARYAPATATRVILRLGYLVVISAAKWQTG